jgi:hypothetical protein
MIIYKLPPIDDKGNLPNCITKIDGEVITGIPLNQDNTDYQAFTRWLNDGNIPLPADEGVNNGETTT